MVLLPKTGSDGGGYVLVGSLGHTLVPRTPALVPLVLEGRFHERLQGVSQDVDLKLVATGAKAVNVQGALLWTHFGASGPAILDVRPKDRPAHVERLRAGRHQLQVGLLRYPL